MLNIKIGVACSGPDKLGIHFPTSDSILTKGTPSPIYKNYSSVIKINSTKNNV